MPESDSKTPSEFSRQLDALIDRWTSVLPTDLQQAFRRAFQPLGPEHDRALDVIETLWNRREHDYNFDEIGLARRGPFHQHLVSLIDHARHNGHGLVGVLFIDLDRLKRINDTFGHDAGDRALTAVGAIVRHALRSERDGDFVVRASALEEDRSVSRHGGDEFVVAVELKHASDIDLVARRIKLRVADPREQIALALAPIDLSVSIGGVVFEPAPDLLRRPETLARELVTLADAQMYESKRDGRVHIASLLHDEQLVVDRAYALDPKTGRVVA